MEKHQPCHWLVQKIRIQKQKQFIQLDIKEYFPSATEETLDKAISFVSSHTTVSLEGIHIIKNSRKLLLFHLEYEKKVVAALM